MRRTILVTASVLAVRGFVVTRSPARRVLLSGESSSEWTCADDVLAAVAILEDFDRKDQAHATHADRFRAAQALGAAGIQEQNRALRSAVALLVSEAPTDQVRLGFLASDVREAKTALGEWVRALNLTRGLLTGADENGVPIEVPGPIFVNLAWWGFAPICFKTQVRTLFWESHHVSPSYTCL